MPSRGLEKMRCRLQDQTLDWSPSRLGAAMGNIARYRRCGTAEQRACVIALLSHHFARVEACGCQADTLGVGFGVASVLHMWGCDDAARALMDSMSSLVTEVQSLADEIERERCSQLAAAAADGAPPCWTYKDHTLLLLGCRGLQKELRHCGNHR